MRATPVVAAALALCALARAAQIPNLLSLARLVATPVVVALLLWAPPNRLAAAALFSLASITDYLDGYLARRWQVVSQFGVFCDLMADKLLVASTLIAMVGIGWCRAWMVIVIVGRELVVSGLRSWAAAQGVVSRPASGARARRCSRSSPSPSPSSIGRPALLHAAARGHGPHAAVRPRLHLPGMEDRAAVRSTA